MKRVKTILLIGLTVVLCGCFATACGTPRESSVATDPSAIKSERVSEAQWNKAFDSENVSNVTMTLTSRSIYHNLEVNDKYDIKFDGDKFEETVYALGADGQFVKKDVTLFATEGNGCYEIEYDEQIDAYFMSLIAYDFDPFLSYSIILGAFRDKYDEFHYDNEAKAYIRTKDESATRTSTAGVKITSGKVSVIDVKRYSVDDDGDKELYYSSVYQFYDYGKTTVNVPDNTTKHRRGKMSKYQWSNAFSGYSEYANCTVETAGAVFMFDYSKKRFQIEEDGVTTVFIDKSNNIYGNGHNIYDVYRKDGEGEWELLAKDSADYSPPEIKTFLPSIPYLSSSYDAFTFDLASGCYVAENVKVDDETQYSSVIFKFDDGKLVRTEITAIGEENARVVNIGNYCTTVIDVPQV